jgi:hypothetical protein
MYAPIAVKTYGQVLTAEGSTNILNEPIPGILIDLTVSIQYGYSTDGYIGFPSLLNLQIDGKTKVYDGNYAASIPSANPAQGLSIANEAMYGAGLPPTGALPNNTTTSLVAQNRYQRYVATLQSTSTIGVWSLEYFIDQYPYEWTSLYNLTVNIAGFSSGDLSQAFVSARLRYYSILGLAAKEGGVS